jgi:hypothetical protein
MNPRQSLRESIDELRDKNKEYPRRTTTLEEFSNAKLNEIYSLLYNFIEAQPRYKMVEIGLFTLLDVIELKCDELQNLLQQMNDETWDIKLDDAYINAIQRA